MGSICLLVHQLDYLAQPDWYAVLVPLLHPDRMSAEARSEIPSTRWVSLIVSRRLAGVDLVAPIGVPC